MAHYRRVNTSPEYRDRGRLLAIIGIVLLLAGAAVAFLGPLETSCFPLFSEGGRSHYEGFGFGSLMFGIIAGHGIGYPMINVALIRLVLSCSRPAWRAWPASSWGRCDGVPRGDRITVYSTGRVTR
jgi:hypothetical protein